MTAGERFKGWLESLADSWKDRLRGWMASWFSRGIDIFLESTEPSVKESMRATLTRIRDYPHTPAEIKAGIDDALKVGDWKKVMSGWLWYHLGILPSILQSGTAFANLVRYDTELMARTSRLDPISVITAWRRDPAKYEEYFNDLREQGWSDDRIEALKFITLFYPSPGDLVRWQAREVFEPEMVRRYGLDDELGAIEREPFYKAGMTDEQITNYWRAHWEHASWLQVVEMLRRGQMTEQDVRDWFRLVEIPPFWRQKLINISREVPTRVDVRRFWDMRTIDEARLREIYIALGYYGKDLDDYVLWTKIYTDFPDLLARYKNGWISLDQVKSELIAMGMKPERAETLIQEKIKKAAPERVAKEKDLTKADIVKGVLKNVITRAEAATLLVSIGYSAAEAEYILAVGAPEDEEAKVKVARELTKSDIAAAVKAQILTPAEAIPKLVALRYKLADATFLSKIYAAQISIAQVEPERDLTKGDITSALKAGIILAAKARQMLQALRYSADDIEFLITANAPPAEKIKPEELRQVPKVDIMTAHNTGAITDAEAITRLVALQYSPADATFLVALEHRVTELKAVTKPKEESRADVTTAVKKGLITPEEGYLMLLNLDFSPTAAQFILSVATEETPFSPMNYTEFQDIANKWRLASGMEGKPMTEELKTLGTKVVRLTAEVEALRGAIKEEEGKLVPDEVKPAESTVRLKELQVTLHRAEAELARVQTDYNAKITEWRHGVR